MRHERSISATRHRRSPGRDDPWRAVFGAFCASLVGIGLARFAYTPLLPAIIEARWFAPAMAAYLGAANLAGYLAGALLARGIARRATSRVSIRAAMVTAAAAFFACAHPLGVAWFFAWRFASGFAGGLIMVLAAPAVLPHVPAARRGLAGGLIFTGVGAGVAASGTLVPLLLAGGPRQAWMGLGLLSAALCGLAWSGWPDDAPQPAALAVHGRPARSLPLGALYLEYGLNAAAWIPHMLFLVDFVARDLGQGVAAGPADWVVFGIGATVGPLVAGHVADRVGFGPVLRLAFLVETAAILIPSADPGQPWLVVSSFVVGAFVSGTVSLVLGRIHELVPHSPARQKAAWGTATTAFALMQAAAAYGFSFLFAHGIGGGYRALFALAAAAMAAALAIDLAAGLAGRPRPA